MANWENNNKNVKHRKIFINAELDDNGNAIENTGQPYDVYFLSDKNNNFSKLCFINKNGIRFDFYNKCERLENEADDKYMQRAMYSHIEKVIPPEDLKFDKPLNAYVNFFNGPDKRTYISGLTKHGARIVSVINDNPQLIDEVKNEKLKRILSEESAVLISKNEENKIFKYKQKIFACEYIKNSAGMLDGFSITYENQKKEPVKKEYKLSIYHLNKAFLETKRSQNII